MPVILELIHQPDTADLADLEKIYADYPLPPVATIADWLFDQRDSGKTLIAGRFNGRLLAALWLNQNSGRIEHLCVRASTRRRGTARQLLQLLQQKATQFQLPGLSVTSPADLDSLWLQLDFTRTDSEIRAAKTDAEWVWRAA